MQRVFLFHVLRPAAIARARAGSDDYISLPRPGTQLVCTNKTFTFPPETVLLLLLVLAAVVKGQDLAPPFFPQPALPPSRRRHRRGPNVSERSSVSLGGDA